jgi:putative ABC transport system permease protein
VKALIAFRVLFHEKGRSILAITGIFVATLLIFVQLGFYNAVPRGGLLLYDAMNFDLMLTSSGYVYQSNSQAFPRNRIYQAAQLSEVQSVAPIYQATTDWLNREAQTLRGAFVIGFELDKPIFEVPDITRQINVLQLTDTILADNATRAMYGPLTPGRVIELSGREVTIAGSYKLGTGFVGLAVALVNDVNFQRLFPSRNLSQVNLALVRLKAGSDPDHVATQLRALLPADTRIFTREQLYAHEERHWMTRTSTGPIFGFGVVVAVIVGVVILYQMLATQISRQLSQYATLKALGFTTNDLTGIIVSIALIMSLIAYVPACGLAIVVYKFAGQATALPTFMTWERVFGVLLLMIVMSVISAHLSMRKLVQADPADLF